MMGGSALSSSLLGRFTHPVSIDLEDIGDDWILGAQVSVRIRDIVALVIFVALTACQDSGVRTANVAVRDSAGIEIIENAGDPWSAEELWHVAAEPVVRIGAVEGGESYLFDGIRGIVVLDDGRIVVANSGDSSLRWFDAEGVFLFERGGAGEGPGEFSRLGSITVAPGDSIVAVDWAGMRFTLFGADGGVGPTRRMLGLPAPPGSMHRLSDGSWVVGASGWTSTQFGRNPAPGVHRVQAPILRVSSDGESIDTLGMFPGGEAEIRTRGESILFGSARFAHQLEYDVANDEIYIGTGDRMQVDVYSPTGQHVRSVRAPEVDVRLTPEIAAAYRDFIRERTAENERQDPAAAERTVAEMELPETMPAYSSLIVDEHGNLWVGEYRYDLAPPHRYIVFDPEGRFITGVTVPPDFLVMTIANDHLWGRLTDDLDVQYVVGYAIVRDRNDSS
jgi:hypothetical protein